MGDAVTISDRCTRCGGYYHGSAACPTTAAPPAYVPVFTSPTCPNGHDFAVGPTHAVCNRCEKVVKLDV